MTYLLLGEFRLKVKSAIGVLLREDDIGAAGAGEGVPGGCAHLEGVGHRQAAAQLQTRHLDVRAISTHALLNATLSQHSLLPGSVTVLDEEFGPFMNRMEIERQTLFNEWTKLSWNVTLNKSKTNA